MGHNLSASRLDPDWRKPGKTKGGIALAPVVGAPVGGAQSRPLRQTGVMAAGDSGSAGYSGTPLPRKLGVKDDHLVFLDNLPEDVMLGDLGAATLTARLPAEMDLTITFQTSYAALARRLPVLFQRTSTHGMVWVCWPKKAALRRFLATNPGLRVDLDDGRVRELGLDLGFVDVKVAAIDETWSGLKFVRRLKDRNETPHHAG